MPPGRTLVEALFGRSGPIHRLLGGGKQAARQQVAHLRTSAKPHAQAPAQQVAAQTSINANGRLVQGLTDVLSSLIHAPGVRGNAKTIEGAHKVVGRTINARAAYHTLSQSTRPRSGFGNVRPSAIPRSGHNLGLSSARNFSSSRTVFENVVNNAPLGLRVLGDKDRLDMRKFKREMKAAYLKKRQAEAGKGKGRMNAFDSVKTLPTTFDPYFPVAVESAAPHATVQLILPLNPVNESTTFLSYTEDAESSRFFSAMLMSDLHMLSELHGNHHARLRNIIRKLEMAGCFEPDPITGEDPVRAQLDQDARCIIVTFSGSRWGMADVRQVLGLYDLEATTWYKLVDLGEEGSVCGDSPVPSTLPSDVESLTSSVAGSVYSFDETEEYERVVSSLRVPTLGHPVVDSTPRDSYLWGVSDFLEGLDAGPRPSFRRY